MASAAYDELANTILPVIQSQMQDSKEMWPNVKGLFVFTVTKQKKPATVWYLLLQGKDIQPVITNKEEEAREATKGKVRVVRIQVEDKDAFTLISGGVTGMKAFMTGKIKVKGDLLLAQRLEEAVDKMGARELANAFINQNKEMIDRALKAKL
ncbi:hypothetical protein DM01DRAFT_1328584 [Hesseltinella vesiculosa]|uniref:SCP2 domain-containing protein n=1 Tax=Hesseltinella vesiculosa TaxID=101127 RepID=A0A1X2G575_9FUNG|nr:hypothetical protein DM01DRAFT_1328584 [Hesseltinella vesiculosa]